MLSSCFLTGLLQFQPVRIAIMDELDTSTKFENEMRLRRDKMLSTRMSKAEIVRLNQCTIATEKAKGYRNKVGQADKIMALIDYYEKTGQKRPVKSKSKKTGQKIV